jgi:hypothetical protein
VAAVEAVAVVVADVSTALAATRATTVVVAAAVVVVEADAAVADATFAANP